MRVVLYYTCGSYPGICLVWCCLDVMPSDNTNTSRINEYLLEEDGTDGRSLTDHPLPSLGLRGTRKESVPKKVGTARSALILANNATS